MEEGIQNSTTVEELADVGLRRHADWPEVMPLQTPSSLRMISLRVVTIRQLCLRHDGVFKRPPYFLGVVRTSSARLHTSLPDPSLRPFSERHSVPDANVIPSQFAELG